MGKFIDLTGKKFAKLEVVSYQGKNKSGRTLWLCKCDCGNEKVIQGKLLRNGTTRSCGCLFKKVHSEKLSTHRLSKTRIYNIWNKIKTRCYKKNDSNYKRYGGRGIKMCEEWKNDFLSFYKWSMENGYSDNLSIDRIDVNGNYEPSNCRWADSYTQANNKRNNVYVYYNGESKTIPQWSRQLGIPIQTLNNRIYKLNWSIEDALSKPSRKFVRKTGSTP